MKRARSVRDLPFLVAAFVCLSLPARGENAAPERSLASQVGRAAHKVENGIHKGSMVQGAARMDPLGLIGAYQLDYALWTLLGEPVEDYLFRWELGTSFWLAYGEQTSPERIRREDPDLYKRLAALAPVSVTLRAQVHFFDSPTTRTKFASADLEITPDLTAPSGQPQPFSVPGSPEWGAWFTNLGQIGTCSVTQIGFDRVSCIKLIWKRAKRVEVASIEVIGVEWPEVEARMLFAEIMDRRRRAAQKTSDRTASDEDFWSKPAPPAPPPAAQRSDIRTKTVAETSRPLDKKAREARQKRYAAQDESQFSFWLRTEMHSCWLTGLIHIVAHKSVSEAAPTVVWDGTRLPAETTDLGAAFRHRFYFKVSEGDHTIDVTLAGPRPISRHERVRCSKREWMDGGDRRRQCECEIVK